MCLSTVSSEKPKSSGIGYKVLRYASDWNFVMNRYEVNYKKFVAPYYGHDFIYVGDTTNDSNNHNKIIADDGKKYTTGFHIFATKLAAKKYLGGGHSGAGQEIVAKVKYRKAYRQGTL